MRQTDNAAAFSGKKGAKSSPDPLDRYLEAELGRELPKLLGKKEDVSVRIEQKIDSLADEVRANSLELENERLKRELAEIKEARMAKADSAPKVQCVQIKSDGEQCKGTAVDGYKCAVHRDK